MSVRVSGKPVAYPKGVQVSLEGRVLKVQGQKGTLQREIHSEVEIAIEESQIVFKPRTKSRQALASAGTERALTANMIKGVTTSFEKKLLLVGVGYRAQMQGNTLVLSLGKSHPDNYAAPEGITITTPTQTEIIVSGANKAMVGQVAAEIRRFRPPEPYKGKGIRYSDEVVKQKETKKK
jgi:large subunit ribosomal protein L6